MQKARSLPFRGQRRALGVSLIELLVAAGILAVLASLAIPSFAGISRQYRMDAVTEEFMASVQFTRVKAIHLGQDFVILRDTACAIVLSTTSDWGCGWRVFADLNDNRLLDGAETVVQSITMPPGIKFQKAGGGSPQYLHIDRFGRSSALGQRFEVYPQGMNVIDGQLICFSTGTRLRKVKHMEACPPVSKTGS